MRGSAQPIKHGGTEDDRQRCLSTKHIPALCDLIDKLIHRHIKERRIGQIDNRAQSSHGSTGSGSNHDFFRDRRVTNAIAAKHLEKVTLISARLASAHGSIDVGFDIFADNDNALIRFHGFTLCRTNRAEIACNSHCVPPNDSV